MMLDDFGGPDFDDTEPDEQVAPEPSLLPFPAMRPNEVAAERWAREVDAYQQRGGKRYRFESPIQSLEALKRQRAAPAFPWPEKWPELAKRCRLYVGQCLGVVAPSGGGKTSFGIELLRGATAAGHPCLWLPAELDNPEVTLRTVANTEGVHMQRIREEWSDERIENSTASVTDMWHYVDKFLDPVEQVAACRAAIQTARRVYRMPPVLVVDYLGKMASLDRDPTTLTRALAEQFRSMAVEEECFIVLLNQTSRANTGSLTGRVEIDNSVDAMGAAGGSSEIEHGCAVMIVLNVFMADNSDEWDTHAVVPKSRTTGMLGKQGMRLIKAGGQWRELDYLPATPIEIKAELKRASKDKGRIETLTPEQGRADLNAARAGDADAARRNAVRGDLARAGVRGRSIGELRRVRGAGKAQRLQQTLQELERAGEIEHDLATHRWRFVQRMDA